jgi:hypothetical protein
LHKLRNNGRFIIYKFFQEQGGYLFGSNLATTVNNIPNALHWWNEEGKLLDGDSMPACSIVLASKIIKQLEQQKDKDLSEKKKKKLAEDELKLAKSAEASKGNLIVNNLYSASLMLYSNRKNGN